MTREEISLLLYLETRAVDYAGRVDGRHLNAADREIIKRWVESGFIQFGRICAADVNAQGAEWVSLSYAAMKEVHAARLAKAERTWAARTYQTTEEKRNAQANQKMVQDENAISLRVGQDERGSQAES